MAQIKTYAIPMVLHRYRRFDADTAIRELDAIVDHHLYFVQPSKLNDPMEGIFRDSLSSLMLKQDKAHNDKFEAHRKSIGVVSLTETFDHFAMWAHYADQFRGICVAYQTKALLRELPDEIDLVRMSYDNEPPTLYRSQNADPLTLAKTLLATKHSAWASEREWRLISSTNDCINFARSSCVCWIYAGPYMPDAIRERLVDAMRPLKIPVLRVNLSDYELKFDHVV